MSNPAEHDASAKNPAASALAARVAAFRREQVVVDYANRGLSIAEIAARLGISEPDARRKLRAALVRALPETPEDFAAQQMSRLNEALLVAFSAMETVGLKAVDRVLRILRALDRHAAAARPLVSLAAAGAGDAAPAQRAASPALDAAASRERTPMVTQPPEKAQNQTGDSDPPQTSARPAESLLPDEADRRGEADGDRPRPPPGREEIRPSPSQGVEKPRFETGFGQPPRPGGEPLAALGLLAALAAAGA